MELFDQRVFQSNAQSMMVQMQHRPNLHQVSELMAGSLEFTQYLVAATDVFSPRLLRMAL